MIPLLSCFALLLVPLVASAADPLPVLNVWPKAAPRRKKATSAKRNTPAKGRDAITSITNVSTPTSLYKPAKDKNTGAAVIIAPGWRLQRTRLGTRRGRWSANGRKHNPSALQE